MPNFFFVDNDIVYNTPEPELNQNVNFTPSCLDVDESRTFHQGKSFRCWKWEDNRSRTFINDDFYQDFVSFKEEWWMCVNTTTDVPGLSEDWIKLVSKGAKGDKGDKGDKGENGNGNMDVGNGFPIESGFEGDIYLDIDSGIFYEYTNNNWYYVGKISVGGDSIDIEWQDE